MELIIAIIITHADNRVILSENKQYLDRKHASLLVVSPQHGNVIYTWEKIDSSGNWVKVKVPVETCLLYAWSKGLYRCTVSGEFYNFEVSGN